MPPSRASPTPATTCCSPAGGGCSSNSSRTPGTTESPARAVSLELATQPPCTRTRRNAHVRRTLAIELRSGPQARRSEHPPHRHHRRPPHCLRCGPRRGRFRCHRQRGAAGRAPAHDPVRPARPSRRGGGQGLGHRRSPGRLLRLGLGPRHRRPAPRWRGLVPLHDPLRAHRRPAARRSRRLDAHLLRAGQSRVARVRRPGRVDGAGRAHHGPRRRHPVRIDPHPASSGGC